ncbi:hypothetical protein EJB05_51700 [Eragrostis curvula]|uniref:Uncharacterized protein n=1 Tax=Eragrostis curvula TaxID=38414 RepID=A0A5J9SUT3_9POAL|nr:hypothetical protein EJB05_51700 [Eragrostis curvula]
MPCGACGCPCGEAFTEDAVDGPPLLENGRPGRTTDSTPEWRDPVKEWGERAANRMIKFFVRFVKSGPN